MPSPTPPLLQNILREFEEAMLEHEEPQELRERFYRYLQLAMSAAEGVPVP